MRLEPGTSRTLRWCYDFGLSSRDESKDKFMLFTGMFPYLIHKGIILVTDKGLQLTSSTGQPKDNIAFEEIESLYLGYDEFYSSSLTKNYGALWAPLRIRLKTGNAIYLIEVDPIL